ncbi:MAG: hypothetical protein K0Q94_3975 [Paenibacillus sp.]|jgi:hypothetical protein|uniref:hypothetical protein n=1 Tax=Paenibacillus sp. GCM10012303 TaxID=3317340 RepID=UPI0029ED99C5|nr:hypothetical protein [Paenibacillus sp.]
MSAHFQHCVADDDYAKIGLFLLQNKQDVHPSFTTLDAISLLYSYLTDGHLYLALDTDQRVIAASAYYHGTAEQEFQDTNIALIDIVIVDPAYRGTRLFLNGFRRMVHDIAAAHPEVEEIRLAALAENEYLCRLYARLTESRYEREGNLGKEIVFCVKINRIKAILNSFLKV